MKLAGQVVLVTGAGRGIGRQVTISYAQAGATVLVADKNMQDAAETVRLIESEQHQAAFIPLDVSVPEEITRVMHSIKDTYGLNILSHEKSKAHVP